FQDTRGLDGRIHFFVHPNPQNKILHTILVGEMNGLVQAATLGTPNEEKWGHFGGPRAYTKWVQPEPTTIAKQSPTEWKSVAKVPATKQSSDNHLETRRQPQLPARPKGAVTGSEVMKSLQGLSIEQREAAILREISGGN